MSATENEMPTAVKEELVAADKPYMPKHKKNIFLTGFMGSGKTSVGRILARLLKVNFYDSDELVMQMLGMNVMEIFSCYGEAFFREKETEALHFLSRKAAQRRVISTGGGVVLREENRAFLRKNGIIVYLDVSAAEAYQRLKAEKDRPLLKVYHTLEKIEELLQKRKPFYLQADLCVNTTGRNVEDIAAEIAEAIRMKKFSGTDFKTDPG